MARFLLAVWPFSGHVFPNIAIAHALRTRGHEVAFYTGAALRSIIEEEKFTCVPFQQVAHRIRCILDFPEDHIRESSDVPELYQKVSLFYTPANARGPLSRLRQFKAMYRDWLLGTIPQQVEDLEAVLVDWKPDVLVCDPFMWGPILVLRETQTVPVAVFSFFAGCLLPGRNVPPFGLGLPRVHNFRTRLFVQMIKKATDLVSLLVRNAANRLRRGYGLKPITTSVIECAAQVPLYLVSSVPEFDYYRHDLPPSVHYVGPCLWDRPSAELAPTWLEQIQGELPLVYVTEGTAQVEKPLLLSVATKALATLPVQAIMTTGLHRSRSDVALEFIPPNIRMEQWVPHSHLLPRVHLMVSQGGSGTVLSALREGVPQVVVPTWWDQFENARRIVDTGVGLWLHPKRCTPERLRTAVKRVLENDSFCQNAKRLAAILARSGGAEKAADLLLNLSSERN